MSDEKALLLAGLLVEALEEAAEDAPEVATDVRPLDLLPPDGDRRNGFFLLSGRLALSFLETRTGLSSSFSILRYDM